jgi:hypothetical protein
MKVFRGALLLTLIFAGCHKRTPPVSAPPPVKTDITFQPTDDNLPPVPAFPPPNRPANLVLNPLAPADTAFNAKKYAEAATAYEQYVNANPDGVLRDQAFFGWGLSLALVPNPDWPRVITTLQRLAKECPESPLRAEADLIRLLATDNQSQKQSNKRLSTELDKLKQIDAERRKRP